MYNSKRSLIALLGLLLLIGVVAALTPFKAHSQQSPEAVTAVQDVRVVNTPAVPVQSKIVNSTAAPVPVTGTIKLGNLASSPANVRSVETIGQVVYQARGEVIGSGSIGSDDATNFYQVPAGKRLVIEHVSAQAVLPTGQKLIELKLVIVNSDETLLFMEHLLPIPEGKTTHDGGSDWFSISLPLRIYVDPGMKVGVAGFRDSTGGDGLLVLHFSGFLVNPA